MEVWKKEDPRVNFEKREAILIFILYQNCPVLAMKYPFLNTHQGGIQNSRRSSRLIRHLVIDVKIFLMFIVAENSGSVNIS